MPVSAFTSHEPSMGHRKESRNPACCRSMRPAHLLDSPLGIFLRRRRGHKSLLVCFAPSSNIRRDFLAPLILSYRRNPAHARPFSIVVASIQPTEKENGSTQQRQASLRPPRRPCARTLRLPSPALALRESLAPRVQMLY